MTHQVFTHPQIPTAIVASGESVRDAWYAAQRIVNDHLGTPQTTCRTLELHHVQRAPRCSF